MNMGELEYGGKIEKHLLLKRCEVAAEWPFGELEEVKQKKVS
jgi:hypothetical protein